MGNNIETELKLQIMDRKTWCDILTSSRLAEIGQSDEVGSDLLEACYYDTKDKALRKAGFAYRIRREGGRWVATVKGGGSSAGGLHMRQEWNVNVEDCTAGVAPFLLTPVGERLQEIIGSSSLELLFITRFERRILLVRTDDGSLIEAAADRGEIIADDKRETILELELELKGGNLSALLDLGAELAGQYPLVLEPRSKYYRGLLLAEIERQDDCAIVNRVVADNGRGTLITAIIQVLNAQSCFLRMAGMAESLILLRNSIHYLHKFMDAIVQEMPDSDYRFIKTGLDQLKHEVDTGHGQELVAALGAGRYTALLLKLWAWAIKTAPESQS